MKRFLSHIALCLIFSQSLFSQEIEVRPGDFLYGFSGGTSFGKVNLDGADKVQSGFGPFIGLSSSYALSHRLRANFAGYYSFKTSIADTYSKIEQSGMDLQLFGQYKIDDFYLNFGAHSQTVVGYRSYFRGNSNFRLREEQKNYSIPAQQIYPMIGLEFKVMDNWRFFSNYSFDISGDANVYQFGLTYRINKRSAPPESDRSRKRRVAKRQIRQLRDGALLVRLKTAEPTIEAMEKRGFTRLAQEKIDAQREENISIMRAFNAAYNFSEVKFFYSSDSRKVLDGEYEGIFLNDKLERDSAIVLNNKKNVFTCELANIEEDTARYFSHYELVSTGNFAAKQVPRFYGGGQNSFYAMVIKDREFNQLSRPFPYYSRALFKSLSEHPGHGLFYLPLKILFTQTPLGSIEGLNSKLYKYWERVERKYPND